MRRVKKFLGIALAALLLVNVPVVHATSNTVSDSFRVATYNIAAGKKPNIELMNSALEQEKIDVVGVQEVDMNTSRNNYDMLAKFKEYNYFTDTHFQKAISYGGGEYGIGLLSRYSLEEKTGAAITNEGNYEARAYVRGVFEKDGKKVAIYNTHLTHESQSLRAIQMQDVLNAMAADPIPYKILTGDFNTDQSTTENYPMMKNYNLANGNDGVWYDTYNGVDPSMKVNCIDNVVTSRNIKVNEIKMVETGLSDHNMLYIDCQLLDQAVPSTQLLDYLLADARNIKQPGYSEESYQALQEAINTVEQLAANSSQDKIDEAVLLLETKMAALEQLGTLDTNLIPKPLVAFETGGNFTLNSETVINVKGRTADETNELAKTGEIIAAKFRASTGYPLEVVKDSDTINNSIVLMTVDNEDQGEEGYTINATESGVKIVANHTAGVFRAVQTLRQMLPADIEKAEVVNDVQWNIPCSHVEDKPEYEYRGTMLDVSRHFFTVEDVKRHIDNISQYKINKLHLHLSDDQGWRLEIKGDEYANLTELGASTSCTHNGERPGFYTQEDFKEIIRYAQERYVEIIPEFDMPGHAWAALVSLPMLNSTEDGKPHAGNYDNSKPYQGWDVGWASLECHNENTYKFIDEVIKQVSAISPSKYMHIGGDEAHSTSNDDYKYFMNRVVDIAKKYGKTPIGWQHFDNAVEDKEGTVTQFWSTGNAKMNSDVKYIASPADYAYIDMKYDSNCDLGLQWAAQISIKRGYEWDPTNYGTKDQILGIECPMWSETLSSLESVNYLAYPRMLGHAEIGWTPKESRSWDEYKQRLITHGERLENQGINYYKDEDIWKEPYVPVNSSWNMDEGTGTTVNDSAGLYPGTISGGVSWIDGVKGKGLQFEGNGYVDLGIKDLEGNWSASMWVNRSQNSATNTALLSGDQGEIKLEQWKNTQKIGITEFGVEDYTFNYSAPIGEWVHLTFVSDGNGTSLFVNGEYQDRLNVTISGPAKRIGANAKADLQDSGNLYASLDEVCIFNKALTADEIKELAKLPEVVSKTELQDLYDKCSALKETDYTEESWNEFKIAMDAAKGILDKADATQIEVDNAKTALENAKNNLVEKVVETNKVALSIAIEMAESVTQEQLDKVVPAVANEFIAALENAKTVYAKGNATQEEVDNAFDRLSKVMQMLEFYKGDKNALQKMMDQIAELTASEYTDSTWNALQAVLPSVNEVLGNVNAMQDEVNEVYTELVKAFINLRLKPNKDLLEDLINQANRLNRANYTAASWILFEPELAKANGVLNDPEATKEQVENAVNGLTKAIAGLVENNIPVDNNVNTPDTVKPGDSTVNAIKTGDENMIGVFLGLIMLSMVSFLTYYKKREN